MSHQHTLHSFFSHFDQQTQHGDSHRGGQYFGGIHVLLLWRRHHCNNCSRLVHLRMYHFEIDRFVMPHDPHAHPQSPTTAFTSSRRTTPTANNWYLTNHLLRLMPNAFRAVFFEEGNGSGTTHFSITQNLHHIITHRNRLLIPFTTKAFLPVLLVLCAQSDKSQQQPHGYCLRTNYALLRHNLVYRQRWCSFFWLLLLFAIGAN